MLDYTVVQGLNNFIDDSNRVLRNLDSAHFTEGLDAATDDNTLVGYGIAVLSRSRNMNVSHQVNRLRCEAQRINDLLARNGLLHGYGISPLNTYFDGGEIRRSEANQHSFFANLLSGGRYSSYGSINVMNSISHTRACVQQVRDQALLIRDRISAGPFLGSMKGRCHQICLPVHHRRGLFY